MSSAETTAASKSAEPKLAQRPDGSDNLDVVNQIFEHRLQQSDLENILAVLNTSDRDTLIEKMSEILRRVSALMGIYNRIADALDLDVLLNRLIEIITEALNADRSTLFLHDDDTGELFSRVAQGDVSTEIRFPSDWGIAGSVFTTGDPILIQDAYADPRFNPEVDKRTGYRTRNILCVPLRNREGRIIGATQVLNKHHGDFDNDDRQMLDAITLHASVPLENAKLHENVERARREEEKMREVANAISTELQLEPLLEKIMSATTELLNADRSTLFMYDAKNDQLWSQVAEGVGTKEIRFPAGAGIAGSVFRARETLNIPDAYADARFNPEIDKKTGYKTNNILCMPVINKAGASIGVTQVLNKHTGPFTVADERRLQAFSSQAAIALENAQLFEDVLNERNYSESILKSLSNGVITLDSDWRIIKVNEAAQRLLKTTATALLERTAEEIFTGVNSWVIESIDRVRTSNEIDIAIDTELKFDDEEVSVNSTVVSLIDIQEEPIGFMLVFEDISEEKRIKGTMARYMSKDVVDKLLESGQSALGGTTQEVSILFSDIRSFTTISERIGARKTVSMLNSYFSEMVDIIFDNHGILDKYIGDAIMSIFGAPFTTNEDADNAIKVGNEMLVALRSFNAQRESEGKEAINIGIGINTGEVVAGNIGSPKRMDYTVIGDGVNLAARLEGACKYYKTRLLFSEFTYSRLKEEPVCREIDLIRVKGKNHPVSVYEALGYHNDSSFPNLERTLSGFKRGLAQYRQRDWRGAIMCFQEALSFNPNDGPSQLYLERALYYQDNSPGDDWDGVWTLTEK
ncbi:MAG: GAF domain-containing protein [Proteobacteria bacterium]|nr:GAF domain-containing protein [Pseudomonadota bacterium]